MQRKRFLSLLLTLILLLSLVPAGGVSAKAVADVVSYPVTGGNLTFDKLTGTITDCDESVTEVVIPKTIDGVAVTSIGDGAFSYCGSLTNITIPNSVTSIGEYAFSSCGSLTNISIPNSVTSIGDGAFSYCGSLTSISIPNSVTSIGDRAFYYCRSLMSIKVAEGNAKYCSIDGVLFNKDKTELICYPAEKTDNSYTIPNSVTSIGDSAFFACESLTSITMPNSVTSIGDGAFSFCGSLTSITIPNSVTSIGDHAFEDCHSLANITIPNSVTSIGDRAFSNCFSLTNITIPNSVTSIGDHAFGGCGSLTNIMIPSSVTSIGDHAFCACDNLANVYYSGSESYRSKIKIDDGNTELTSATWHYQDFLPVDPDIEESNNELAIAIFSTEKSLSVQRGDSMWLGFGLINTKTNSLDDEWRKMAVVVSDPTVVSLSDYEKTEYGYSLELIGKKEGSTNIVITDTENGSSTSILVSVFEEYSHTYSYGIDEIASFSPNNSFEKKIATNIYDLNGLYVNHYQSTKQGATYQVSFDVYNQKYYTGAVDIYDKDGRLIDYEEIEKFQDITSLWDTGEQLFHLITDPLTGKFLTYEDAALSEHTPIEITVPEGGYFTISNNLATSPGTLWSNSLEMLFEASVAVLDLVIAGEWEEPALKKFKDSLKQEILHNEKFSGIMQGILLETMRSEVQDISRNFSEAQIKDLLSAKKDFCTEITELAEDILDSYQIEWKHMFQSATGVGEAVFTAMSGYAGAGLQACFAMLDASNKLLMAIQIAVSTNQPYVTVYSNLENHSINPHGVIIDTNGNVDSEAVLQVFRVSNDDSITILLDSENPLEHYELYNICFVKNDQLVQPNGTVKAYLPIPEGMNGDTCTVYRQEADGVWSILDAHIEGNYLVFETSHFSLYALIGDFSTSQIHSLPDKTKYRKGEILNTEGLVIDLNGELISEGFICEPTILSESGKQTITVKCGCVETEFEVKVSSVPEVKTSYLLAGSAVLLACGFIVHSLHKPKRK